MSMSIEEKLSDLSISNDDNERSLKILEDNVRELYKLRDLYFETHPLEDAIRKNTEVKNELEKTLLLFQELSDCANYNRAKYCYLKGKALNITRQYNKNAEETLSKAIKLDPKLADAWNELGECHWKNDNLKEAKNCFLGALNQKRNQKSLRNLSIIARQESLANYEARIKNIERGVELAKEAVKLDPQDGISWAVLGNAQLSSFFGVSQNPMLLKKCISAYTQAEKDVIAKYSPDLHYNKGITYKYEEEYKLALDSFNLAISLDPSWEQPQLKEQSLVKYLNSVTDLAKTCGKLKGKKRLSQLLQNLNPKQLGPYFGGLYMSRKSNSSVKLQHIPLCVLQLGLNCEKVVLGKVVCSIFNDDTVPFTFCIVDKEMTCVTVTVYNLASGRGVIIGDSVAIPEPFVTDVNFTYKDKTYNFRSIRVESPLVMVVNSKKVTVDQQAHIQFSIEKKV